MRKTWPSHIGVVLRGAGRCRKRRVDGGSAVILAERVGAETRDIERPVDGLLRVCWARLREGLAATEERHEEQRCHSAAAAMLHARRAALAINLCER
jgi:hypothetical protein